MKKDTQHTFAIEESTEPFGFITWDIRADTVLLCPYLANTLAFPTYDLIQSFSLYIGLTHTDDIKSIENQAKKLKTKDEPYVVAESRKLCRDGTWHWFSSRTKITEYDSEGNPVQDTGICTDITRLKEDEAKFQQMKLLFDEINHIKQCHKMCENEYRTQSSSFKREYPKSFFRAEILKSLGKITHSSRSFYIPSGQNNLYQESTETDKSFDCRKRTTNDLQAEIQDLIKILRLNKHHTIHNGNNISLLGIYIDLPFGEHHLIILERKDPFENRILDFLETFIGAVTCMISLKKLKNHHEELGNITSFFIEQVPAAFAMFDTNMCYKFASDAWCKMFKLGDVSNLTGKSHYETYPVQPKEWREIHVRGLAGETISCSKQEVAGFTKEPFWTEWVVHPWYAPNKSIGGIIIYVNNITDRVNYENTLNQAVDNLTRSNQALERFAHVCSHDLKEPLRSASCFMNLLFKRNSEHFDEESLSYMNHILKSMSRMSTLIHDLLLFSEVKQISTHKKKNLDLNDIVHEAKESFDLKISEIGAQIKIDALPTILGIKTQFNQLFTNLIGNAIKFRSKTPLVIDVFAIDRDDFWEIHVRDNGIGISAEYQNDVFAMFKRLHSKSQYEGSGIGLATCKKIIEDLGGEIYVQAAPEGGSDFVFTLPKV